MHGRVRMDDPPPPRHRRRYRVEIVEYLDDEETARETLAVTARMAEDVRRRRADSERLGRVG